MLGKLGFDISTLLASAPPRVMGIEKLTGGAVTLRTIARVDPYRRDEVARDLRRRIKSALDGVGVATVVPSPVPAA